MSSHHNQSMNRSTKEDLYMAIDDLPETSQVWFKSEYLANFGVQYNFNNISVALLFLSNADVWYSDDKWNGTISSVLKSIVFIGSMFGMCSMGYVGDVLGRNKAFVVTSMIMVCFSLLSAFALWGDNGDTAMIILAVCRFGLGFGIGGCYPLSAAKSAEDGDVTQSISDKNFSVGLNLLFQAIGNVAPYAMALLLNTVMDSAVWKFRICLAVGSLPPFIVMLCLQGEEESNTFKQANEAHMERITGGASLVGGMSLFALVRASEPEKPLSGWESFMEHVKVGFEDPNMFKNIIATCLGWFIYDIAFYGSNAFIPTITSLVFSSGSDDGKISISSTASQGMILTAVGIPGVIGALMSLSLVGTKSLSVWGFLLIAFSMAAMAVAWETVTDSYALFGFYILIAFAVNWGPNMTTFVLPQEVFPVEIRATFNGFAAACGKLGAVAGIWIFQIVSQEFGIVPLMVIVCILNIIGAIICQTCISDRLWTTQQVQEMTRGRASTMVHPR